jgi:galactokinase/mevalonate kinase-like predicted kinase
MVKAGVRKLLSVPPAMRDAFSSCEQRFAQTCFVTSDPEGTQVGSGGGTAHVLAEAFRASGEPQFESWLAAAPSAVVHGGGQSRRLPAYAPAGKLFLPVPVYRWALGQCLDQTLLDMQGEFLDRVAQSASASARVTVASGDVLLRADESLPEFPDADVVMLGMWTQPEEAQHFGVMFCDRSDPERLVTFLQKPTPNRIRELGRRHLFLVDVGVWLLSARAVRVLMAKSGWDAQAQAFEGGAPGFYDLYGQWGPQLGAEPQDLDEAVNELTCAVVPLPDGGFYHFGCTRDVIDSAHQLQHLVADQRMFGTGGFHHPRQFILNSEFACPRGDGCNHTLWVENSTIPESWSLASEHCLTGVPPNSWSFAPETGVCLDFVPIGECGFGVRPYGMDDGFRGEIGDSGTLWLGRPFRDWLKKRNLSLSEANLEAGTDLQDSAIFVVLELAEIDGAFLAWLTDAEPQPSEAFSARWVGALRLSATQLASQSNLPRLYASRGQRLRKGLLQMASKGSGIFHRLDLRRAAELLAGEPIAATTAEPGEGAGPLAEIHDAMFRSVVARGAGDEAEGERLAQYAFERLAATIVDPVRADPVLPKCDVLEDQIVWGRAPVRIDLAGGWSDTPPYCLEHGGATMNLALDLNGQPPIQVFARRIAEPHLVIKSIDLGVKDILREYADVGAYAQLGAGFAVARAAFALCGFHPDFSACACGSLGEQLELFGGGIEVSMLAAVPKGSGLGTSSILSATLLGTLSDFCGLGWDRHELIRRTLVLEQLLTSGGGWQDQVGGVFHGAKLVETVPGPEQAPVVRWLPRSFFTSPAMADRMLLYYTGITRVARHILAEIVQGMFLNSGSHLQLLGQIRQNAHYAYDAVLREDANALVEAVRRSWQLNQQLDAGTNVPGVQAILDICAEDLAATKLLGAGGGGYLFMIARDSASAQRIRDRLEAAPPNPKARVVDISLSREGLQVTRS